MCMKSLLTPLSVYVIPLVAFMHAFISRRVRGIPQKVFPELSFLPLPLIGSSWEHCKKFDVMHGQSPSDKDRPSCSLGPSKDGIKTESKNHFWFSGRVRRTITLTECLQTLHLFTSQTLTLWVGSSDSCERVKPVYLCSSFFPPDLMAVDKIMVKEVLTCNSPIEAQYSGPSLIRLQRDWTMAG